MANKERWKGFWKKTFYSLLFTMILGTVLNTVFLRSVRIYSQKNIRPNLEGSFKSESEDRANRLTRFTAAMLKSRELLPNADKENLCRVICRSSDFNLQESDSPIFDGIDYYNSRGRVALNDFNFQLGLYALRNMSEVFPKGLLKSLVESQQEDSLAFDFWLSLKMQFTFIAHLNFNPDRFRQLQNNMEAIPDMTELNHLCRWKQVSEEKAFEDCRR